MALAAMDVDWEGGTEKNGMSIDLSDLQVEGHASRPWWKLW